MIQNNVNVTQTKHEKFEKFGKKLKENFNLVLQNKMLIKIKKIAFIKMVRQLE